MKVCFETFWLNCENGAAIAGGKPPPDCVCAAHSQIYSVRQAKARLMARPGNDGFIVVEYLCSGILNQDGAEILIGGEVVCIVAERAR